MIKEKRIRKNNSEEIEKEEQVTTATEQKPRWKVKSGGITLLNKQSYSAGETFEAWDHEIPSAFRDILQCFYPEINSGKKAKARMIYELEEVVPTAEEEDMEDYVPVFNIVNGNKKVISEKPMTKEAADAILNELNR